MTGMEYITLATYKDLSIKNQQSKELFSAPSSENIEKDKIIIAKDILHTDQGDNTSNEFNRQHRLVLKHVVEVYTVQGNDCTTGVHGQVVSDKVDTWSRQSCCHEYIQTPEEVIQLLDTRDETVIDIESLPLNTTDNARTLNQISAEVHSVIGDLNPSENSPAISQTASYSRTTTSSIQVMTSMVKWMLLALIVVLVVLCLIVLLYIYIASQSSEQSLPSTLYLTTTQQPTAKLGSETVLYTIVTSIRPNKTQTEQSFQNIKVMNDNLTKMFQNGTHTLMYFNSTGKLKLFGFPSEDT